MKSIWPVWKVWVFCLYLGLVFPSLSTAANHMVILQYHHFGSDTPSSTSISLKQFDSQLAYLEKHRYQVWPLEKGLLRLRKGLSVPEKCVAITVDDAYISVYKNAFPRLKKRRWPFTVFVATEGIDDGGPIFMTWSQMREMAAHGVDFAPHGHTHPYMIRRKAGEDDQQWKKRMTQDIQISRQRLKDELGATSSLFAYPYGEWDLELKKIVRNLGMIGIAQQSGVVWQGSDFGAVPRFPMSGNYAEISGFKVKIRALPLPVIDASPINPIISADQLKPILRLKLAPGDYLMDSLACYVSGQGKIGINWINRDKYEFEVIPRQQLPKGRSRYNCTARHLHSNRYYWYSHQWIRGVE